jgi:hypothetical protein
VIAARPRSASSGSVFGQPPGELGFGNANGVTFAAKLDDGKLAGRDLAAHAHRVDPQAGRDLVHREQWACVSNRGQLVAWLFG